jgi:hypothetical protein
MISNRDIQKFQREQLDRHNFFSILKDSLLAPFLKLFWLGIMCSGGGGGHRLLKKYVGDI